MSTGFESPQFAARVYDATKIYGEGPTEVRALDGVTVGFGSGRFTAIMGPSGSGKSTLVQCLAGLDRLSVGRAFIGETEITRMGPGALTDLRRAEIGFVFQAYNLVPSLTAEKNILLPFRLAGRRPDRDHFEAVVARLGLAGRLQHRPAELSGGQQQRVAVARALVARPNLLIADEPTGNLDSRSGAEILDHIRAAVDAEGQTVVMVTHDPRAAARADHVMFLVDGRVVQSMSPDSEATIIEAMKALESGTPGAA